MPAGRGRSPVRQAVRNRRAVLSVTCALLALGVLVGAAAASRYSSLVGLREAAGAIPLGLVLSVFAIRLGRQGTEHARRTLGRSGGRALARLGRALGGLALLISITAVLAVGVFAVLTVVLD
jgi:hypothetical protein